MVLPLSAPHCHTQRKGSKDHVVFACQLKILVPLLRQISWNISSINAHQGKMHHVSNADM